jgi:hypothetical protein
MLYRSRFIKAITETSQHFVLPAGRNADPETRRVRIGRQSRSPRRSSIADFAFLRTTLDAPGGKRRRLG